MRRVAALAALLGACAPARPAEQGSAKHAGAEPRHCSYAVKLVSMAPAALEVEVACRGFVPRGFAANAASSERYIHDVRTRSDRRELFYRVDLEGLARGADHFDLAQRVGNSIIATASSFLLSPSPASSEIGVSVRIETPPGVGAVSALSPRASAYALRANEIAVASYTVFGSFQHSRHDLTGLRGATSVLEIAILDRAMTLPVIELRSWIVEAARAVAEFWSGFPVPHALVVVVPVQNRERVLFGKVLPESSPGIALVLGTRMARPALYRDWILIHELFHLGSPSFAGEGKWFDEGLATYYEPIIRARAGFYDDTQLWAEFVRDMPQGLSALTRQGLENARDYRDIYWGGALLCLQADLALRRASGGQHGLEEGLRALLAEGGDATQVWSLAQTLSTIDAASKQPLLAPLARRYRTQGAPFDLNALWTALGIKAAGTRGVTFSKDAAHVALRRALVYGGPPFAALKGGRSGPGSR
jgi:hypothetical protein